ncbi:MAG: hypothetical protein HY957_09490 [Nitrospirae bacterium]|nr:hypothetical protein [Nitrospirota bacterium]
MRALTNDRGFTLVEMLLAVLFGIIVMAGIGIAVQSVSRSGSSLERKVVAQQDVRAALEIMAMEIGMVSYNPTFASNSSLWSDLSSTAGQACGVNASVTNPTWKGIVEAGANSFTVEADINDDGVVGSNNEPNEVIRYVYVTTGGEQYITRCSCCTTSTSGSGGQPFLGDLSTSGRPRGVKVINNSLGIPVFEYFDASGAATASIPDIRRIEITLVVEIDETGFTYTTTGAQKRRLVYSTSVIPRNHGITY